ncbi:hypothetical protein V6M93_05565 [Pectobacterium brasiliense]|uniref:Uncharacterized protein n=1 Tax=Pectobacterium brasiliense TaxID=180957 RepID=A0A086EQ12_9GAMM|nr:MULTISPECIES: hypothetical protein [Pectobacterium]AFR04313.1 hypothetical protein PCC21_029100 [Pectobacterium carotovorum subsp. carotovorum PCC21]ARA75686.1 hypothetical protein B5S52_07285 [Pectobacterium brasiliense]ATV45947.1 hypothetical protein CTV95_22135 [Pectobacterium brasiliense]KFF68776.1 hypothetical protein IW00_07415 [Pectobacterium brasiliense]KGA23414.1 hypothetical protein KS44_14050 [Pectobacterium brasiliense]
MKKGIEVKLTMLRGIIDLMTSCDDSTELETLRNVALTALVIVDDINDEYCHEQFDEKRIKS